MTFVLLQGTVYNSKKACIFERLGQNSVKSEMWFETMRAFFINVDNLTLNYPSIESFMTRTHIAHLYLIAFFIELSNIDSQHILSKSRSVGRSVGRSIDRSVGRSDARDSPRRVEPSHNSPLYSDSRATGHEQYLIQVLYHHWKKKKQQT